MTPLAPPAYRYRAVVLEVHDGDTFTARIDLGFRTFVEVELRVRGIDAPELNTPAGQAAQQWADVLLGDEPVIVETFKRASGKDVRSFTRWVADVYLVKGGADYAATAVGNGHATYNLDT